MAMTQDELLKKQLGVVGTVAPKPTTGTIQPPQNTAISGATNIAAPYRNTSGVNAVDTIKQQIANLGTQWQQNPANRADIAAESQRLGQSIGGQRNEQTGVWDFSATAPYEMDIKNQLSSLEGQRAAAEQAAQFGVGQNQQFLNEQLAKLGQQQAVQQQGAQELQNRRGGFYSGGLDYQLGELGRTYGEQTGALTRDIASRNAQLMSTYGNQANQIASQIQNLQSSAPDLIRQKIGEANQAKQALELQQQKFTSGQQQQEFENTMAQRKFDENVRQFGMNYALQQQREGRLSAPKTSGGGGGEKVSSAQINNLYNTLQKKYGVMTFKETGEVDDQGNPIYDEAVAPKYANTQNPDQQARLALEILNQGLSDDQELALLNKFGLTEDDVHRLLGE